MKRLITLASGMRTGPLAIVSSILFFFPNLYSQSLSDTIKLPEFEIKSEFSLDNQGFKRIRIDSSLFIPNLKADLSEILSRHSSIFIKSYGSGTLATPSFRGTSAQHTQVEWNGISLNSPMLGQMDFSQVPVAQFDGLEILYGAAGISRTSGAFGGVIDLVTNPDWNNVVNPLFSQSIASFSNYNTNVSVAAGSRSLQSHTRLNFTSAVNDFPYTSDTGSRINQQNASYIRYGISQELYFKIKDKHLLTGRLWYLDDDRNLPPTTTNYDPVKKETLREKALRGTLDYKIVGAGFSFTIRSAINDQYMHYQNNMLDLSSVHKSLTWTNKARLVYSRVKKLVIKPGIDYTFDRVISDDYDGTKTRNSVGLFAETVISFTKKLTSSIVMREEIIDGKFMPFIPAIGMEYKPFSEINLALSANLARNVHVPTLNDLYWKDYGNPALKPEINYSAEAGLTWNWSAKSNQYYLETTISGYYSRIFDMITWTPVDSSSLYRPENIDEILARGVEVGVNGTVFLLRFLISIKANYTFTRSTYEKASSAYDDKIGNQQIYIPLNAFNATATIERWKFYLMYNYNYTGDRYTGKENLSIMPAYNLSNIIFGRKFGLKKIVLSLQLDINNLFDLDYQSIANRPMPGINYAFTLKVAYRKNRIDEFVN